MSDTQSTPRSKLDLIYQEVLGEAATLIQKLETVNSAQGDAAVALVKGIDALAETVKQLDQLPSDTATVLSLAMVDTGKKLNADLVDAFKVVLSEHRVVLDQIGRNMAMQSAASARASKINALTALLAGFASSLVSWGIFYYLTLR